MKTGIVISDAPTGGYAVSLNGTKLGSTGSFGDASSLLAKARVFADGAAAAIFATTGAVVSITELDAIESLGVLGDAS